MLVIRLQRLQVWEAEHLVVQWAYQSRQVSGVIDVSSSTPGTYTVTYTTNGTCPNSSSVSVTINALDDASFNYSTAAYCVDASDPTPTITGLGGGTFSSTAGLSITAGSGAIDVSSSTPGTYTVTYTTNGTCPK